MSIPIKPKWVAGSGLSFGRPAIVKGLCIFGSAGENGICRAIRLADGSQAWQFVAAGGIFTDIVVEGGLAYFASQFLLEPGVKNIEQSFLYAVDVVTGLQRWRVQLDGTISAVYTRPQTISAVATDTVLIGSAVRTTVHLLEVDKGTGTLIRSGSLLSGSLRQWRLGSDQLLFARIDGLTVEVIDLAAMTTTVAFATTTPIRAAALTDKRLYLACSADEDAAGTVTAVNLDTWTNAWEQALALPCQTIFAQGDHIVLVLQQLMESPAEFRCIDAVTGGTLWTFVQGNRGTGDYCGLFLAGKFLTQTRTRDQPNSVPDTTVTVGIDVRDGTRVFHAEHPWSSGWIIDAGETVLSCHVSFILALEPGRFWSASLGGAIRGTPSVSNDRILTGNANGMFTSLDLFSGEIRWQTALPAPVESSPAVLGNRIAVGHGQGVSALDGASGAVLWTTATSAAVTGPVRAVGDRLVFGGRDRMVHCVALGTGQPAWTFPTGGFVEGGAAMDDTGIFIGSDDGTLYALDFNGAQRWRFNTLDEIKSTPLLADDLVIFGNDRGLLTALARADGSVRWQRTLPGSLKTSSPTLHFEHFWIGDEAGNVHRIAVADGLSEWSVGGLGRLRGAITWHKGELFASSLDGEVLVLDMWSGAVLRRVKLGSAVFAAPVVGNGAIAVVDEQGGVHALVP